MTAQLSGLPHHKGLDAFDFAFQPDLDARKVRTTWPPSASLSRKPTWPSSAHPGSARPCSRLAVGLAIADLPGRPLGLLHHPGRPGPQPQRRRGSGRFAKKLQTYLKPAVLVV